MTMIAFDMPEGAFAALRKEPHEMGAELRSCARNGEPERRRVVWNCWARRLKTMMPILARRLEGTAGRLGHRLGPVRRLQGHYLIGLRAKYLATFLNTLQREDLEPPVVLRLPIAVKPGLGGARLHCPKVRDDFSFMGLSIRFDPTAVTAQLNLMPIL